MKILQLCNKPPLPAVDGGCIAMNNVTQGLLHSGHDVKFKQHSNQGRVFADRKRSLQALRGFGGHSEGNFSWQPKQNTLPTINLSYQTF